MFCSFSIELLGHVTVILLLRFDDTYKELLDITLNEITEKKTSLLITQV